MLRIPLTQGKIAMIDEVDIPTVRGYSWHAGKTGGSGKWYAMASVPQPGGNPRTVYMHRLIATALGWENTEVDHISGNGLDNRRSNLRPVTDSQNVMNSHKQRGAKTTYKGVAYRAERQGWTARVMLNGKSHYCGLFTTEEEAARAYDAKAKELFDEFALLNFPLDQQDAPTPRTKTGPRRKRTTEEAEWIE